jgi:hypothetical protein
VKLNSSDTVARVRQYRAVPPEIAAGETGRSLGFWPLILDYALPGVRDQHADDLDCAAAHPHGLALHRRKPVADKVCQQLGWEAVLNQHIEGAPARPGVCEYFEGSALLGTKCHRSSQFRPHGLQHRLFRTNNSYTIGL